MSPGDKINKWTLLKGPFLIMGKTRRRKWWLCKCECGTEQNVLEQGLKSGSHKRCSKCGRSAYDKINWRRVAALHARGWTWNQIAHTLKIHKETLRKWRRRLGPRRAILNREGSISYFSSETRFRVLSSALEHYSGNSYVMMREYYKECARREIEKLERRARATSERTIALRARGLEYAAIDHALHLADGSAYVAERRRPASRLPVLDMDLIGKLEEQRKPWSEINKAVKSPYPSGLILKEVFYFLISLKIEYDQLAES